jgi:phage shock protein PspC (stress-responsive transcriptional regulator)
VYDYEHFFKVKPFKFDLNKVFSVWHGLGTMQCKVLKIYIMKNFKIRRKKNDKMIAGVCAGIARSIGIDPLWVRLAFITLTLTLFHWLVIVYIIAAFIIPTDDEYDANEFKKVYRLKEGKMIGGICSGLEQYFNIDVVAIRLFFIVGMFLGFSFILYPILWIITPKYKPLLQEV